MNNGWIKLHRKSLNSSVWKSPIIWMVWSWCLMKATHDPYKFPFNGDDIELLPGQFITGRKKAIMELPISERQFRTAIEYLRKTKRLTSKTTNRYTLIIVNKWQEYQTSDQQVDQQTTSKRPHTRRNKKDKNILYRDGQKFSFKDGTVGIMRFGEWVDFNSHAKLGWEYLKEFK